VTGAVRCDAPANTKVSPSSVVTPEEPVQQPIYLALRLQTANEPHPFLSPSFLYQETCLVCQRIPSANIYPKSMEASRRVVHGTSGHFRGLSSCFLIATWLDP
jgi:hypothetical protein